MTDIIGGVLMMVGGGLLTHSSLSQLRAARPATEGARALLGNTDSVVVTDLPRDMRALLSRLD